MLEQLTIFDFIDTSKDDIKMKLESLQNGDVLMFGDIEVKRDKYYVVEQADNFWEVFPTVEQTFRFINSLT